MNHLEQMPYTRAFIQELMRHRTLVPLSVMRKTNEECSIDGYVIPKNTMVLTNNSLSWKNICLMHFTRFQIIPNIWSVHHDPELFENPEEFRPERFLDRDGKFVRSSYVIPFSVGPRQCLGKELAIMELFIFLTGIIQKLKILPDPEYPLPPLTAGISRLLITYEPPDCKLQFVRR